MENNVIFTGRPASHMTAEGGGGGKKREERKVVN